jgi:hypothetical protein
MTTVQASRRDIVMGLSAAGLATVGATGMRLAHSEPSAKPNNDPVPNWWREVCELRNQEIEACVKPGNGDFDSPEMLDLDQRRKALEQKIINREVTSLAGAAAKLEWVAYETGEGLFCDNQALLTADAIRFIRALI